jgi:hypothetical protein
MPFEKLFTFDSFYENEIFWVTSFHGVNFDRNFGQIFPHTLLLA